VPRGSAPVGAEGTAAWLQAVGEAAGIEEARIGNAVDAAVKATAGALARTPIEGRIHVSGYEGSELLVARILAEAGAEITWVGTALPKTPWSAEDREWLEARGVHVQYRASFEQNLQACRDAEPDLAIGTTPLVQAAKEEGTPALYFTNLISARPIFGPMGAAGLSEVIKAAIDGRERLNRMRTFFEGVGTDHATGYGWTEAPKRRLTAKERNARARGGKTSTGRKAKKADSGKKKAAKPKTRDEPDSENASPAEAESPGPAEATA